MTTENSKPLAIAREQAEKLLELMGVRWEQQSGFMKVFGPKGRHLYIGAGKGGKTFARVDLSGFTSDYGTRLPAQGVFGNVKQQLEMRDLSEEDILRNLGALVEYMMSLPPVEPKAKKQAQKPPKNAGPEVKTEAVLPDSDEAKAARAARLELIKRVAAEKGVKVSEETLAETAEVPAGEAGTQAPAEA